MVHDDKKTALQPNMYVCMTNTPFDARSSQIHQYAFVISKILHLLS